MRPLHLTLVLVLGLALTGCGWNPFHKIYSATAEMEIGLNGAGYIIRHNPKTGDLESGEFYLASEMADEMKHLQSPEILTPIIESQKLDRLWSKRLHSDHSPLTSREAMDT